MQDSTYIHAYVTHLITHKQYLKNDTVAHVSKCALHACAAHCIQIHASYTLTTHRRHVPWNMNTYVRMYARMCVCMYRCIIVEILCAVGTQFCLPSTICMYEYRYLYVRGWKCSALHKSRLYFHE